MKTLKLTSLIPIGIFDKSRSGKKDNFTFKGMPHQIEKQKMQEEMNPIAEKIMKAIMKDSELKKVFSDLDGEKINNFTSGICEILVKIKK